MCAEKNSQIARYLQKSQNVVHAKISCFTVDVSEKTFFLFLKIRQIPTSPAMRNNEFNSHGLSVAIYPLICNDLWYNYLALSLIRCFKNIVVRLRVLQISSCCHALRSHSSLSCENIQRDSLKNSSLLFRCIHVPVYNFEHFLNANIFEGKAETPHYHCKRI